MITSDICLLSPDLFCVGPCWEQPIWPMLWSCCGCVGPRFGSLADFRVFKIAWSLPPPLPLAHSPHLFLPILHHSTMQSSWPNLGQKMWTSAPLPSPDIDIYIQTHQICLRLRCVYVWVFVKCDVYFRYTADKYDIYGFFHVITCLRFFVSLSTNTVVSTTYPVLGWSKSKAPVEVRTLESPRNPVDSHGAGYSRGSQETNFYSRGRPCILVVTHDYPDVMKWHYPIGHHRNEWRNGTTTPSLVAHLHQ